MPIPAKPESHWRTFLWGVLGCGVLAALVLLLDRSLDGLILFGAYSVPTNSVLPAPHEPGLLHFAKSYHPLWIAAAGAVGSGLGAVLDYAFIGWVLRHPRTDVIKRHSLYKWGVKSFLRRPFATVFVFALTPLPVYVVRLLAPASGYSLGRYVTAMVLGRFPRFLVVAWIGYLVPIPGWVLVVMFAVLVGSLLLATHRGDAEPAADPGASATRDGVTADVLAESGSDLAAVGPSPAKGG